MSGTTQNLALKLDVHVPHDAVFRGWISLSDAGQRPAAADPFLEEHDHVSDVQSGNRSDPLVPGMERGQEFPGQPSPQVIPSFLDRMERFDQRSWFLRNRGFLHWRSGVPVDEEEVTRCQGSEILGIERVPKAQGP